MESGSAGFSFVFIFLMVGLWAAIGVLCGKQAQRKGYSFWIGFAAGFFLGLIGVLVIYLIKPASGRTGLDEPYRGYDRQDGCTGYPPPGRGFVPPAPGGYVQPPPEVRHNACQTCANLVPGDARYCPYCGSDVSSVRPW